MNFRSNLKSQSEENSNKIRFKNVLVLSIAFSAFVLWFSLCFGSQKSLKNHKFLKKLRFEGLLWSSIAFKLLFEWILKPLELDFPWFLCLWTMFFDSLVAPAEMCMEHVRLQTLLWWLGRRGADHCDWWVARLKVFMEGCGFNILPYATFVEQKTNLTSGALLQTSILELEFGTSNSKIELWTK